jgi:hypothetical protein
MFWEDLLSFTDWARWSIGQGEWKPRPYLTMHLTCDLMMTAPDVRTSAAYHSSSRQRQSTGICYGTSITLTCGLILHSGT